MINKENLSNWDPHVALESVDIDLASLNPDEIALLSIKLLEYQRIHPDFKLARVFIEAKPPELNIWRDVWVTLQHLNLDKIQLVVPENLAEQSLNQLAEITYTPTYIGKKESTSEFNPYPPNKTIKAFENQVIANLQKVNQAVLMGQSPETILPPLPAFHQQNTNAEEGRRIKLKALIGCQKEHLHDYDHLISVEVQQRETEQQEEDQQVEEVAIVSTQTQIDTTIAIQQEPYQGRLVDFIKFGQPPYFDYVTSAQVEGESIYQVYREELFGNLPNAIRYLTPEAALYIAKNAGTFATFNPEDLNWALIKQKNRVLTNDQDDIYFEEDGLVLDYDPNAVINRRLYEPVPIPQDRRSKPIYDIDFPKETRLLIQDFKAETYQSYLKNVWIKYGDLGVKTLLSALRSCDETHAGLSDFLLEHYFKKFPHWDYFLNSRFLAVLEKVKQYDADKLACFKTFIERTDSRTQFDLVDITQDFDRFWGDWCALAQKNQLAPGILNGKWYHRPFGHPSVYMKRLWTLLNNARDVREQLICMSGTREIRVYVLPEKLPYFRRPLFSSDDGHKKCAIELKRIYEVKPANYAHKILYQGGRYYLLIRFTKKEYMMGDMPTQHGGFLRSDQSVGYVELDEKIIERANINLSPEKINAAQTNEEYHKSPASDYRVSIEDYPELMEHIQQKIKLYQVGWKPSVYLKNYQDYYASQQGFKVVDIDRMGIQYEKDSKPFNPNDLVYAQRFPTFTPTPIGYYENLVPDNEINLSRFIGQQPHGIKLHQFFSDLEKLEEKLNVHVDELAFGCAYTMTNEQYDGVMGPLEFGQSFMDWRESPKEREILRLLMPQFLTLLQQGFFISTQDALTICKVCMVMVYNNKTTLVKFDEERVINRLFQCLQDNFSATMRYVRFLPTSKDDHSHGYIFLTYALDTADFLTQNAPDIASCYRQDLLLFSALINTEWNEAYYVERGSESMQQWYRDSEKTEQPQIIAKTKDTLTKIKAVLSEAASLPHPNNLDLAIQMFVQANKPLSKSVLLEFLEKVQALPTYDPKAVEALLLQHKIPISVQIPDFKTVSAISLKQAMIELIQAIDAQQSPEKLYQMEVPELQALIAKHPLYYLGSGQLLKKFKETLMKQIMLRLPAGLFRDYLEVQCQNSAWANETLSFEVIEQIMNQTANLVGVIKPVLERPNFIKRQDQYLEQFKKGHIQLYHFETLTLFWTTLAEMPERDIAPILDAFFEHDQSATDEARAECLMLIRELNQLGFPSPWMTRFIHLYHESKQVPAKAETFSQLKLALLRYPNLNFNEPILSWLMTQPNQNIDFLLEVVQLTAPIQAHRQGLGQILAQVSAAGQLKTWLSAVKTNENQAMILAIISACREKTETMPASFDYLDLVKHLNELSSAELGTLQTFVNKHDTNLPCLNYHFERRTEVDTTFDVFLAAFEKNPFGQERDFSTDEVERVVNHFIDLNQRNAYPYAYRKQMMEAFLFVNRAGQDLPIYLGKPAQALTDEEIQRLFLSIKRGEFGQNLTPFMRHLYALGLMREAMFRKTGQFPYSTQMLALIDCLMHEGDVISNIDTGQGKSLVDVMKGCLLWLNSDRVDITTASIIDAERDLKIYHPFLSLLGIPHKDKAVRSSPTATLNDIQQDGINFSTLGDMGMITAKLNSDPTTLPGWDDIKLSLVMNESDYQVLDDLTIYRLASVGHALVSEKDRWIYTEMNRFVEDSSFHKPKSEAADLRLLRKHLQEAAKHRGRSSDFIDRYSDKQLLKWIDAGILNRYRLKEKIDYILTKNPEPKFINGRTQLTRSIKLLRKDGNIHETAQYGQGLHQVIRDSKNQILGEEAFVFEPESETHIALNNKNMIDYYRDKKGLIWGSSATVGSTKETDLQYEKYGFDFSAVQPHQVKQVKRYPPVIVQDQTKQFEHIIKNLLSTRQGGAKAPPALIFFADIPTAEKFYQQLRERCAADNIQFPTPLDDIVLAVRNAADFGMMTVVTGMFGRNTNIPYDYTIGLDVIETCVTLTEREREQRRGRTGRQGSKGRVYEIYNREDFNNQTLAEIQADLEEKAESQRQFNEQFFDILAILRSQLIKPTPAFDKVQWSVFIETLEDLYRTRKIQGSFALDAFIQDSLNIFEELVHDKDPISVAQIKEKLSQRYLVREQKAVYEKPVKLSDCVPPELIAYHYVYDPTVIDVDVDEVTVKNKLKQLLDARGQSVFPQLNNDYLTYLNTQSKNLHVIRRIHQDYLHQYLNEKVSKPLTMTETLQRWLGYESTLTKLVNDQGYLLLFRALVQLDSPQVAENVPTAASQMSGPLKKIMSSLLDEYAQYSWFVNDSRHKAVAALKNKIQHANTPEDLFQVLMKGMEDVITEDISSNKKRYIPVNLLSRSRYQQLLTQLIQLASLFADNPSMEAHIQNIIQSIKQPNDTKEVPALDQLMTDLKSVKTTDPFNLGVIKKSLESLLTWQQNIGFFKGMSERKPVAPVKHEPKM